jgi:hypothetical protein
MQVWKWLCVHQYTEVSRFYLLLIIMPLALMLYVDKGEEVCNMEIVK